MKQLIILIATSLIIGSGCSAERTNKPSASQNGSTNTTTSVVLLKAKNETDLIYEWRDKVAFYGDVLTVGLVGQSLELKNIAKTIAIEYEVSWASRQGKKRHLVNATDLAESINALKEIPRMIDSLKVGEEIRMDVGGLQINFGNSLPSEERIQFGNNGYYVDIGGYQHNSRETAETLKVFAGEFAKFLSDLLGKANATFVQVITP